MIYVTTKYLKFIPRVLARLKDCWFWGVYVVVHLCISCWGRKVWTTLKANESYTRICTYMAKYIELLTQVFITLYLFNIAWSWPLLYAQYFIKVPSFQFIVNKACINQSIRFSQKFDFINMFSLKKGSNVFIYRSIYNTKLENIWKY